MALMVWFWYQLRQVMPMRRSWVPSIVPDGTNEIVYLVLDDLGRHGRVYRETDADGADLETVIADLMSGQYYNPVRVIAFNVAERWVEDVSGDIAREIVRRLDLTGDEVPPSLEASRGICGSGSPAHIAAGVIMPRFGVSGTEQTSFFAKAASVGRRSRCSLI